MVKSRVLYIIFLFLTFFISQTMPHRLTSILFIASLIIPLFCFCYAFIGKKFIKCSLQNSSVVSERKNPVALTIKVENNSYLPFPFISISALMPNSDRDKMINKKIIFSLNPKKNIAINSVFIQPYIGTYECGIYSAEVTDIFKIFKFKIPVSSFEQINIIPISVTVGNYENNERIENQKSLSRYSNFNEDNNVVDIRQYMDGDNLKSIHWNLSTKTDNLMTKVYEADSKNSIIVITDLNFYFDDRDRNLESTNSVIEISLAFVSKMLSEGNVCDISWDNMVEGKSSVHVDSLNMFDNFHDLISRTNLEKEKFSVLQLLMKYTCQTGNSSSIFIITSCVSEELLNHVIDVSRNTNHCINIILFNENTDTLNNLYEVFIPSGINLWNVSEIEMKEKDINLIPYIPMS